MIMKIKIQRAFEALVFADKQINRLSEIAGENIKLLKKANISNYLEDIFQYIFI